MFCSVFVPFAILIFFQAAFAVPMNNSKTFVLTDEHIIPQSKAQNLEIPNTHQDNWIGDIVIGIRQSNDALYGGEPFTIQNNVNSVGTINLKYTLSNSRQTIHYVRVVNDYNSYGVVCADPNNLGYSSITFSVRVPALSTSKIIPYFGVRTP